MHDVSYENEFDLQDNERERKIYFHIKRCVPGLKTQVKGNTEMAYS